RDDDFGYGIGLGPAASASSSFCLNRSRNFHGGSFSKSAYLFLTRSDAVSKVEGLFERFPWFPRGERWVSDRGLRVRERLSPRWGWKYRGTKGACVDGATRSEQTDPSPHPLPFGRREGDPCQRWYRRDAPAQKERRGAGLKSVDG